MCTERLTKTTFDALSESAWSAIGARAEADPADGVLPYGIAKVVDVKTDVVRQNVTIVPDPVLKKRLQLRVNCRLALPKFTPSASAPVDVKEYRQACCHLGKKAGQSADLSKRHTASASTSVVKCCGRVL